MVVIFVLMVMIFCIMVCIVDVMLKFDIIVGRDDLRRHVVERYVFSCVSLFFGFLRFVRVL